MRANARTLSVVRSQVRFEIASLAVRVAEAARLVEQESIRTGALSERCDRLAHELQHLPGRSLCSPAELDLLHRLHHLERRSLERQKESLLQARQSEGERRAELMTVRYRDRALERAMDAERRSRQADLQRATLAELDELWMHRSEEGVST